MLRKPTRLTKDGSVSGFALGIKTAYAAIDDLDSPADIHAVPLDGGASKSLLRISLARWERGKVTDWQASQRPAAGQRPADRTVHHREVPRPVDSQLYLGYGPVLFRAGSTSLKKGAAIQAGEKNDLEWACPSSASAAVVETFQLAHWFGSVGGRCRNGWGSLSFGLEPIVRDHPLLGQVARPRSQNF